jgi:hypothetical protein
MRTKAQNRRYRLHQKLSKAGLRYHSKGKTIYVPWDFDITSSDMQELQIQFGYQVQFEIVSQND